MKVKMKVVVIIIFLFAAGCIQKAKPEVEYIRPAAIRVTPEEVEAFLYPCMTFECENRSMGLFGWRRLAGAFPSLFEGSCKFVQYNMTWADLRKLNDTIAGRKGNWRIKHFMIGQGPNFATANEMQKYCNWSLGYAVHRLTKPEVGHIMSAIKCSLKNNTIPYILLSTGEPLAHVIGPAPIVAISENLSGLGPIFISPEGEIDIVTEPFASDYKFQVRGIAVNCPNCIIIPLIKFNSTNALQFLATTYIGGKSLMEYSAAIAYGVNLSKFDCSKHSVIDGIKNFTGEIMLKYRKPSLIAYITAKPGPNEAGTCVWSEGEIAATYEYLFSQIPFIVPNGLIGMALHDAASGFDELGQQKPYFKAWFTNCQTYMNQTVPELSPQVPLLFPLGGDVEISECTRLNTAAMMLFLKCGVDYSKVQELAADVEMREKLVLCGDHCFEFEPPGEITLTPNCDRDFPAIRQFAAENEIDPSVAIGAAWYPRERHCACENYEGKIRDICCGIQTLAYFYNKTMEFEGKKDGVIYLRIYFTLYGYKYGESGLSAHIANYKSWKAGETSFSFDSYIIGTMKYIGQWRKVCGLCKG